MPLSSKTLSYLWRSPSFAWAMYDFAYSIFIFLFGVRFFPSWIIDQLNRPDWYIAVTQLATVSVVVPLMPLAGALADQRHRRKPFLLLFTLVACIACMSLSVLGTTHSVLPILIVAAIAIGFGQLAVAQFDPLLADVSSEHDRGHISGLAVMLGFVGVLIGLAVVGVIVGDGSKQRAFFPIGVLYLLFALPAFWRVRETDSSPDAKTSIKVAFADFGTTIRNVNRHREAFRFLAGRFLYSDAIVTMGAYLTVYMTRMGGFSEREQSLVIGAGVVTAAGGAAIAGPLVERIGPKRPLLGVLPPFAFVLVISAVVAQPWTIWLAAPVAGVALGVVWTADRVFMLRLAPVERRGQFFAFFNLANRTASAIGPLIWGGTVWLLYEQNGWTTSFGASRVAVLGLAIASLFGWLVIRPVEDANPPHLILHSR